MTPHINFLRTHFETIKPSEMDPHFTVDPKTGRKNHVLAYIFPHTVQEVQRLVHYAIDAHVCLIPQGGNTGRVSGAIYSGSKEAIAVNMRKMNSIGPLYPHNGSIESEAGVTLEEMKTYLQGKFYFPLSLAPQNKVQLGASIASGAGGLSVVHDSKLKNRTLGIQAVLGTGEIYDSCRHVKKNNTGFSVDSLFFGSMGRLGMVTRAVFEVEPYTPLKTVAFVFSDFDALKYWYTTYRSGFDFYMAEMIHTRAFQIISKHILSGEYLLIVQIPKTQYDTIIHTHEQYTDIATDSLLTLRKEMSTRLNQFFHNKNNVHTDYALPLDNWKDFINFLNITMPGQSMLFGHVGDGNLHVNIYDVPTNIDTQTLLHKLNKKVLALGGVLSAEHGIGRTRRDILAFLDPVNVALNKGIKNLFDPHHILNPDIEH